MWMTSLFARVWGVAGTVFARVMADLQSVGAFDRAVELAQVTVRGLAGDHSLSNDQKRAAALDGLARALAAEGKIVRDSLLSLAIELAVNAAKGRS